MIPDASATMLPAALQYAVPSASAAAPGRGPGLAGDVEDALRTLLPMLRERSDRTDEAPTPEE